MSIVIDTSYNAEGNSFSCSSTTRSLSDVKYIVIHYTGVSGDSAKGTAEYFAYHNDRSCGAHFTVGQDGSIYQSAGMNYTMWSVGGFFTQSDGAGSYYEKCTNYNSVSIEMSDNMDKDPSQSQTASIAALVSYIREHCKNANTIIRHWDVNGKQCPARMAGADNAKWTAFAKQISSGQSGVTISTQGSGTNKGIEINQKNVVKELIKVAEAHLGQTFYDCEDWLKKNYPPSIRPWCAAFVSACAGELGIGGTIIYQSLSARACVYMTASECNGTKHDPSNYNPKQGDLIFWGRNGMSHVNIVYEDYTGSGSLPCIGGNEGNNECKQNNYRYPGNADLVVTPDWANAQGYYYDGGTGTTVAGGDFGHLYNTLPTREDAMIREVGFVDSNMKESAGQTNYRIGTVNYTQMLYDVWELYGTETTNTVDSATSYNVSKLTGKVKTFVEFFLEKGLNPAAACGLAGNIYRESNFNCAFVNPALLHCGLAQWSGPRLASMQQSVGDAWKNDFSGQMDFMWRELNTEFQSSILTYLNGVDNNSEGVEDAAFYVASNYFTHLTNISRESEEYKQRAEKGKEYFTKVQQSNGGGNGALKGKSGKPLALVKTYEIPIPNCYIHSGDDCTDYSYWSRKMGWVQGKIGAEWRSRGEPHVGNLGCGLLDGHYTVAMSKDLVAAGDLVRVICKDGTAFSCITVDVKGSDKESKWGHAKKDEISPVEWYYYSGSDSTNSGGKNFEGCGELKGKQVIRLEVYENWWEN